MNDSGPRRLAAAGELLAVRAERREVGARAGAELEEHGLAAGQLHDVFHVVLDALDEAGRALRDTRTGSRAGRRLRVSASQCQLHFAPVTPYWWYRPTLNQTGELNDAVLMQAEPGQLAVEPLAVLRRGEVAVLDAPVGDRAGDAVDQLPDAVLALGRADFAVEVLADDDVGGQLAPDRRDFAVVLLEDHLAVLALDLRAADFPLDGREQIFDVGRAEGRVDLEPAVEALGRSARWWEAVFTGRAA